MPSVCFSDLVELAAGAIATTPTSHQLDPATLPDLLAQAHLSELPPGFLLPHLTLEEITIDIPVYFHISPGHADPQAADRLMSLLPSPLVPGATRALSRFRMTLSLNTLPVQPSSPQVS